MQIRFGENQLFVDGHLEAPARGWNENQAIDIALEVFKQVCRQTDGSVGVMSNRAILN